MIKNFFIPNNSNNYTPFLLSRKALAIYLITLVSVNLILGQLGLFTVGADISIEQLLQQHNIEREVRGLSPLRLNSTLSKSATSKSSVMLELNCWSHYCPPEKEPWDFFKESGYNYQHAGENLAEGFSSIDSVMSAWMNSPTHRENILNPNFKEIGFGFAYGPYQGKSQNVIITVHFGTAFTPQIAGNNSDTETTTDNTSSLTEEGYQVSIEDPENGESLNSSILNIEGSVAPVSSDVGITVNNRESGRVQANGPSYTYRSVDPLTDGTYLIQSKVYDDNGSVKGESDVVAVVLDGQPPFVDTATININKGQGDLFTIDFSTSSDVIGVRVNTDYVELKKDKELDRWFITFNQQASLVNDKINIVAYDSVGNETSFNINSSEILSILKNLDVAEGVYLNRLTSPGFSPKVLFERIKSGGPQTIIPLIFVLYLVSLFAIDLFVLAKTNMIGTVGRKSHLHGAMLLVILIIISFGSITGSILTSGFDITV